VREGSSNPNWKYGISSIKRADDLLSSSEELRSLIRGRILDKVSIYEQGGCWTWTGSVFTCNGRASICLGVYRHLVSRLVYVLFRGATDGLKVLHSCDNVSCVNPAHLWLGTSADNARDMVSKVRQAHGVKNSGHILTPSQVREIREEVGGRGLYGIRKKLAEKYNVHPETISRIVGMKSWRYEDDFT
jgi:hypothetical protein